MQRGPAPRLGHSVQHVIDTVRATRARRAREARSTASSASSEAKDAFNGLQWVEGWAMQCFFGLLSCFFVHDYCDWIF